MVGTPTKKVASSVCHVPWVPCTLSSTPRHYYILVQRNLSTVDTTGARLSVLYREVSLILR